MSKTYASLASARRAVKAAGLAAMNVSYLSSRDPETFAKRFRPYVLCELSEDLAEVRARGFDGHVVAGAPA